MAFYFEKLIVWQKAYYLVREIYTITQDFPQKEQYSLTDQIQRSAVSIVSNIAEWSSGRSDLDHKKFLGIAHWSCLELATQIMLASDFWYIISVGKKDELLLLLEEIIKMLYVMRQK